MVQDSQPIDGESWGKWIRDISELRNVVRRSWTIFVRNTNELIELHSRPANDIRFMLQLMGDGDAETIAFWAEFDQRLHNEMASAGSLVDHTRRLARHCETNFPDFVAEYRKLNTHVAEMNEAVFLSGLRNYLLHVDVPPVVQTLNISTVDGSQAQEHIIQLSAKRLLEWNNWSSRARHYLESFPDRNGPAIGADVAAYANAMDELYKWLFEQRQVLRSAENIPDRFRRS